MLIIKAPDSSLGSSSAYLLFPTLTPLGRADLEGSNRDTNKTERARLGCWRSALLALGCVTLGWPLSLSELQHPHLHPRERESVKQGLQRALWHLQSLLSLRGKKGQGPDCRGGCMPYPQAHNTPVFPSPLHSQGRLPDKSDGATRGLLWQSGPQTHQSQSWTGLVYLLTKPDGGGSSTLLTQRVGYTSLSSDPPLPSHLES